LRAARGLRVTLEPGEGDDYEWHEPGTADQNGVPMADEDDVA
jgi:hypothetical protein